MPALSPPWTRLVRFVAAEDGEVHFGQPIDSELDVGLAVLEGRKVEAHSIKAAHAWDTEAEVDASTTLTVQKLLSPISPIEVGTVRCVGLNYRDHARECGLPIPTTPVTFLKPGTAVGHPGASVSVPAIAQKDELDWEVELAVVIGKEAKDVSEEEAADCVLGYTVANDLSARKVQNSISQWCFAKSFDGFCPLGPVLVAARQVPNMDDVRLKTTVNDVAKQDGSASELIFSIPKIISWLSQGSTLPPGTVIITGTPPGVGVGFKPAQFLRDGDEVRCSISHGMGTLASKISHAK